MATLVTTLGFRDSNLLRNNSDEKKSLKIHVVPRRASSIRFSAGSKPTSDSPGISYERKRVPSLHPTSTTMSPGARFAVSDDFWTSSLRAWRIVGLIPERYQ